MIVDQPVAVTRVGYADWPALNPDTAVYKGNWGAFTLMPFWSVRGGAPDGAFANGDRYKSAYGNCVPLPSTARCVNLPWRVDWTAYDQMRGVLPTAWQGSLLEDKRDKAGLNFRRNRYYDPATGRFTQEDPIGLAGGLNLYGFASGDPVNFSDPFGLCPFCPFLAVGYALYELGSGLCDAYNAVRTAFDPNASFGRKATTVGLAAAGLVLPGGGFTALDDLADAAKALDRGGFTAAGRALTKHATGQRGGSRAFPRLSGNPAEVNAAAQDIVEDILTHPGTQGSRIGRGRFKGGVEYFDPSGRGVRYDAGGRFVGFVER